MIARLKGIVDSVAEGTAVIDVGGVGYLVFGSSRTLGRLAAGEAANLHIETHVREDHIHLYGFGDALERDWFRLLTTVQGVGDKVALAILSALAPDELLRAIASGDKGAVTRANGVGPKLATRILSELKDKVGALALGRMGDVGTDASAVGMNALGGASADAVSALVNLGYNPSLALGAVAKASSDLGVHAPVDALIRAGLRELGGGALAGAEARR